MGACRRHRGDQKNAGQAKGLLTEDAVAVCDDVAKLHELGARLDLLLDTVSFGLQY